MAKRTDQVISVSVTTSTVIKTLVILLSLYVLYLIRDLVLVIITAIVIASAIEPATRWLCKHRLNRILSVVIIYLSVIIVLIAIFAIFLPPLIEDIRNMVSTLPAYFESLSGEGGEEIAGFGGLLESFSGSFFSGDVISKITDSASGAALGFIGAASGFFGGLLSFVLIVVISFYLAVQENGVANFLRIITPISHEAYVLNLWERTQRKIGRWMQGQLLLAVIVGTLTYLGLSILGVSNPMFLALIAAVMELIPVFGPILAAVPAVGFALVEGGISLGLLTVGLYLIIQQFESQLIHPLVVKKIVGIPALVAIIALIIGAKVAGFLGIIISVPVAAAFMEFLGDVERKKMEEEKKLAKKL
jgi:predicted PurR-regulated permease PerM